MKYIQFKENKSRGTFDFPLEYYHIRPGHPRYDMPYHWHTEYEIIRIIRGSFLLNMDGMDYLLKEGDTAFIRDGVLHGGNPENCIYECIVFDMRLLTKDNYAIQKYLNEITMGHKQVRTVFPNPNSSYQNEDSRQIRAFLEIHHNIWEMFNSLQLKSEGFEFLVLGSLYHFFGIVIEHHLYSECDTHSTLKNQEKILQLKQAITMIESEFDKQLTLEQLSKAAGMSPKYFCRFFQEMTHRTPIDYLNYYRIEYACMKLATSSESITDVALSCGFNDPSYFIKLFKRYKGTTPKKYLNAPF